MLTRFRHGIARRGLFSIIFLFTFLFSSGQNYLEYFKIKFPDLKSVEVIPCSVNKNIKAVILVWEKDWWERLVIVKVSKDKIVWESANDTLVQEQSVKSAQFISIKGMNSIFLEVFGQTHMGNGFYYLYEWTETEPILKIETRAVDLHQDGSIWPINASGPRSEIFKEGALKPSYSDINNDGFGDLILSGTIILVDEKEKPLRSRPFKKAFVYVPEKNWFIHSK